MALNHLSGLHLASMDPEVGVCPGSSQFLVSALAGSILVVLALPGPAIGGLSASPRSGMATMCKWVVSALDRCRPFIV